MLCSLIELEPGKQEKGKKFDKLEQSYSCHWKSAESADIDSDERYNADVKSYIFHRRSVWGRAWWSVTSVVRITDFWDYHVVRLETCLKLSELEKSL